MGKRIGVCSLVAPWSAKLCTFFRSVTSIFSGQKSLTRNLTMKHKEMYALLFATTPQLLREVARENPNLLINAKNVKQHLPLSKFQCDMLAATSSAENPGFSLEKEHKTRLDKATAFYCENEAATLDKQVRAALAQACASTHKPNQTYLPVHSTLAIRVQLCHSILKKAASNSSRWT
jgi:hypothetical protein